MKMNILILLSYLTIIVNSVKVCDLAKDKCKLIDNIWWIISPTKC
jgi:hypothetical protein